jgi:hypothetical protein
MDRMNADKEKGYKPQMHKAFSILLFSHLRPSRPSAVKIPTPS